MEYAKIQNVYLVRCDIGDEIVSVLTQFATDNGIASGTVTGIGAVKDPILGYFDLPTGEYLRKEFDGNYELLNLTGNFARLDSGIILHCHAIISDRECVVFGGHLFRGEIAVTGEFYIYPGGIEVNRGPDDKTGLNLIKL